LAFGFAIAALFATRIGSDVSFPNQVVVSKEELVAIGSAVGWHGFSEKIIVATGWNKRSQGVSIFSHEMPAYSNQQLRLQ
jgi:hypothetical protein